MGEQLELFEKEAELTDDDIQKMTDIYEPFVEPTGFGIVTKYCRDRYHDVHYWFRLHFKYPYQRMKRGWSDYDTWNLMDYLTDVTIESVTHLRNHTHGYPPQFESFENWQKELDTIIKAFQDFKDYDGESHKRLYIAYKLHNIPTWKEAIGNDWVKFTDYCNNPKYKLPSDVYEQFCADEEIIYNNIKKRMKRIIDVWGNLWD